MSKSNTLENGIMRLIFQAGPIANLADNAISAPATSLYISLHTNDPGEAGDQTTNEANYGAYARIPITRGTSGFTVSGNQVSNAVAVNFPTCTSGSNTVTHFGIGLSLNGAGTLLYSGALGVALAVTTDVAPQFAIGALSGTED